MHYARILNIMKDIMTNKLHTTSHSYLDSHTELYMRASSVCLAFRKIPLNILIDIRFWRNILANVGATLPSTNSSRNNAKTLRYICGMGEYLETSIEHQVLQLCTTISTCVHVWCWWAKVTFSACQTTLCCWTWNDKKSTRTAHIHSDRTQHTNPKHSLVFGRKTFNDIIVHNSSAH